MNSQRFFPTPKSKIVTLKFTTTIPIPKSIVTTQNPKLIVITTQTKLITITPKQIASTPIHRTNLTQHKTVIILKQITPTLTHYTLVNT